MKLLTALLMVALAGCSSRPSPHPLPEPKIDPIAFFTGHTHGEATLHRLFSSPHHLIVDSVGWPLPGGGLVLDQRIAEQGEAVHTRRWVLHPDGPNRWAGTLTDASGPVVVGAAGNWARIRYHTSDHTTVEQSMILLPDRQTIANRMTIRRWRVPVAWLEERITKPE